MMKAGSSDGLAGKHEIDRARILDSLVNAQRNAFSAAQSCVMWTGPFGIRRVAALHGTGPIEQSSPFPVWLRRLSRNTKSHAGVITWQPDTPSAPKNWNHFAAPYMIRVPLFKTRWGSLEWFMFRSEPWTSHDREKAEKIADAASIAWSEARHAPVSKARWVRRLAMALVLTGLASFPVHLSTIAPAEIVAAEPQLIASSFPAVVRRILVTPNEAVEKDQVLVELDDADQQARVSIAKREFEVATADLRRLSQLGFQDAASRNRLSEVQGQVAIKQLMLQRAELELERTKLRAPIQGVAIVSDPVDWSGRPVQTGEKIMSVANPAQTRVRLWVPAKDGSLLRRGLTGTLYLDSDPWQSRPISLDSWAYEAELSPFGVIAFRALAEQTGKPSRTVLLGLHGTAHLSGESVPLLFYLLRRPIIYVRQILVL